MEAEVLGNTLKLRLYALEDINGDVLFALGAGRGSSLRGDGRIRGQNLKLPKDEVTRIEIKLKDETDRDLEFGCPDALWVHKGIICPQEPVCDDALTIANCASHKLILRYDGTPGPFAFALRLIDEDEDEHLFDPVIINDEV